MKPTFFATPAAFRKWLSANHARESELLVGFYKKDSGIASITWPESVDEALCFGWIDGVRKRIDDLSYSIRFTPRRAGSIWSAINIGRVEALTKLGRMKPAGIAAFQRRKEAKSGIYAYENEVRSLPEDDEKRFRANRKAWKFFSAQPAGYRRLAIYWVTNAKRAETRERRLQTLIADSAAERRLAAYTLKPASTG
jgi:uncharacterized protein YdeI (YjbR/CyaY-like superfamily)